MESVSVDVLWDRITKMQDERRFSGNSYPDSMTAFPFRLRGQGFFPGGDGLWRDDRGLELPSDGQISKRGLMFVGNDFGTLSSYTKLRPRGYENPPTWRHLKARISTSGVPTSFVFATNAVLGLRTEGKALDKKDWESMPKFADFCREFFEFQVKTTEPKLIVVLGSASTTLRALIPSVLTPAGGGVHVGTIGEHRCWLQYTSHPYADFALDTAQRQSLADQLKKAWATAAS